MLFLIAIQIWRRKFESIGLAGYHAKWLMCVTMIFGLGGSKLYEMVKFIIIHPGSNFMTIFKDSGFGSYGLMIFGIGSAIVAMRIAKLSILNILDASVPVMILAIMVGRFACFLSGDGCYGPPTDLPWGIAFPRGVNPTLIKVHPTPLYEILAIVCVAFVLRRFSFSNNLHGYKFVFFLFLVSIARFFTEFYRSTTYPRIYGMTVEQIIAVVFIVCAGSILSFFFLSERNSTS
jgi:phosphatidylglycerol:prolipoprotein diacylglycerol transferase